MYSRRRFISTTLASATATAVGDYASAAGTAYRVVDEVAFKGQTRRLKLTNQDRFITALIFPTDYPTHFRLKPELYPVCTPGGIPVTDSHQYCFIHHQSIMTGHGSVLLAGAERPVDFYRQLPSRDLTREDPFHKGKNIFHDGPSGIQKIVEARWEFTDRIHLALTVEWQSREEESAGGESLVSEQRRYEIAQSGPYTIIDQFSRLSPLKQNFKLLPDRHSFVGVRVHDLLDPDEGGQMVDSEGRVNPDGNYWDRDGDRKAPRWIDCTGRLGSNTAGITLISHPQNVRSDFYCRGWGLMICSATLRHEVEVTQDAPFVFAARYVAHDGVLSPRDGDRLYEQFAGQAVPAE